MSADTSTGWEGILDPGEVILWQGRPSASIRLEWDSIFHVFFFIFWTGFSVFWTVMAATMGGGPMWMFGLLFVGIGAYQLIGIHFWRAYLRSQTHYTLTSKRAFIAQQKFSTRSLDSYPIDPGTHLALTERGSTADLIFATRTHKNKRQITTQKIGFEQIPDAREVMSLMRQIQQRVLAGEDA